MKLWFDENLSPTLVQVVTDRGFEATCNRDRGMLGRQDPELRRTVQSAGYVFVTDNASDFRPMYARDDIHPGLMLVPGTVPRRQQQVLVGHVVEYVVDCALRNGETPADFMLNKLVAIREDGTCSMQDLPHA